MDADPRRQAMQFDRTRPPPLPTTIFGYGFRPMFLLAGTWAMLAMALWTWSLAGVVVIPTHLAGSDWHLHELVFGYVPAVIAGFLLTAVPNWTGRLPIRGWPLAVLAACWLSGRAAMAFSAAIDSTFAAAVDLAFLAVLTLVVAREVVAGRNWRNLKVVGLLSVLWCANLAFHLGSTLGMRAGVAGIVALIILIGGRIIPSFTRNWLVRRTPGRLPAPFDGFDRAAAAVSALALAVWALFPENVAGGALCLAAAVANAMRLARWAGERTLAEPLVTVLHVGYLFVPAGFALVGLTAIHPDIGPPSAALHAWTVGAIGVMTLAVMTRASLGHTGRALTASPGTIAIYGCVVTAALVRIASGYFGLPDTALQIAGGLWIVGYATFVAVYGRILVQPRLAQSSA